MWFITHATSGECVCFLPEKLRYTVGRMGADVELQDDICVSRAHAAFNLVKVDDQFRIEIEDLGSKYGTYLNKDIESNKQMEKGRKTALKKNDLIRFGRLQNVWKIQFMSIDTATSSLSKDGNLQLKSYIEVLGGKISEQWSPNCTHLTMNEPSVTMKLLHALIDQKLVVTLTYWKELLKAAKNVKSKLPTPELHRPDFGDDLIDLSSNNKRKSLFNGTTFVFLNRKHFDMYSPIIKLAGGGCKDLNSGVQKTFLIKDRVVVVQYTPSTQTESSQTISTIAEFLELNSKRIIPEYEIGLAILHCSIDKFCNPSFKMTQTMPTTIPSETAEDSTQVDITDDQNTQSLEAEAIDLEIPETNENMVSSSLYENEDNVNKTAKEESMGKIIITETPVENERKRKLNKVMNSDLDESDEDIFQFNSKKPCNENKTNPKEIDTSDNIFLENRNIMVAESTVNNKTSEHFLQKTQRNKTQSDVQQSVEEPLTSNKENRKRPLIQVLNEDDEGGDDLFSFGDTQKSKKIRNESNREEEDLFSFKEKETGKTKKPLHTIDVDEDSNDMEPTQQFIVFEKVSKKMKIEIPKPKVLPRKVCAIEWISSALGKINIKKENPTASSNAENSTLNAEADVKTEIADNLIEIDEHRKWLESIQNAIEIQQISINMSSKCDKSHYKFKNLSNNTTESLNGTTTNFKKFVKKYHIPSQNNSTVIKFHLR